RQIARAVRSENNRSALPPNRLAGSTIRHVGLTSHSLSFIFDTSRVTNKTSPKMLCGRCHPSIHLHRRVRSVVVARALRRCKFLLVDDTEYGQPQSVRVLRGLPPPVRHRAVSHPACRQESCIFPSCAGGEQRLA